MYYKQNIIYIKIEPHIYGKENLEKKCKHLVTENIYSQLKP